MTIEDLAGIIGTRLTGQDKKFEDVGNKIDALAVSIEKRFVEQEARLTISFETMMDAKIDTFAEMILGLG